MTANYLLKASKKSFEKTEFLMFQLDFFENS